MILFDLIGDWIGLMIGLDWIDGHNQSSDINLACSLSLSL